MSCSSDVCDKWHEISMGLGLEAKALHIVRLIHRSKPEECYRDMIKEWIELSERANWKTLLQVFRNLL